MLMLMSQTYYAYPFPRKKVFFVVCYMRLQNMILNSLWISINEEKYFFSGFITELLYHLLTCCAFMIQGEKGRKIYWMLTIRECEYLECIRRRDMTIYGEVVKNLKERVGDSYNIRRGKESYDAFVQFENPYNETDKLLRNIDKTKNEKDKKTKSNNYCCSKTMG